MKFSKIEGLSDEGSGFFLPKNSFGLEACEVDLTLVLALGLEEPLGWLVGMKVFAAGFGTNSLALTLNLPDVADVGVRIALEVWELLTLGALVLGLLGGFCV